MVRGFFRGFAETYPFRNSFYPPRSRLGRKRDSPNRYLAADGPCPILCAGIRRSSKKSRLSDGAAAPRIRPENQRAPHGTAKKNGSIVRLTVDAGRGVSSFPRANAGNDRLEDRYRHFFAKHRFRLERQWNGYTESRLLRGRQDDKVCWHSHIDDKSASYSWQGSAMAVQAGPSGKPKTETVHETSRVRPGHVSGLKGFESHAQYPRRFLACVCIQYASVRSDGRGNLPHHGLEEKLASPVRAGQGDCRLQIGRGTGG